MHEMPSSLSMVEVRRIDASLLPPMRHAVLWPSVPLDSQLLQFDHAKTTIHYGAFLPGDAEPVGCLTLTKEDFKKGLPATIAGLGLEGQYQVHKFAVLQERQGKGIGSVLFRQVLQELREGTEGRVLLHLDARVEQRGWYERFGLQVLDEEIFVKTGPTGNGPAVEYIRLGIVLSSRT
jgi:GNAT superfamily N-acetyltransferase